MMTIAQWVTSILSGFGTILALCAFAYQVHRARFNQSVDLLFRLENDFFGAAKRVQRARAAEGLLAESALEAEPILDFFETMALLLRRKALDTEMVWHTFYYWIDNYYAALETYIQDRQKRDPLVWKDLIFLVKTVRSLQAQRLPSGQPPTRTREEVHAFLNEERAEAAL